MISSLSHALGASVRMLERMTVCVPSFAITSRSFSSVVSVRASLTLARSSVERGCIIFRTLPADFSSGDFSLVVC
jgi:hypothetical protein